MEVNYKLDLPMKIKIYLVQYITILELAYREYELLIYKVDIYRGRVTSCLDGSSVTFN